MKLWGGRFEKTTDHKMDDFHSSIHFDARLYAQDIAGSIAHATMLGDQGIITKQEAQTIVDGLRALLKDIQAGEVTFSVDAEDIHMNVETLLTQRIGEVGKKLHTGRSRNDQVALDMRLYVKDCIHRIQTLLFDLCETLVDLAQKHKADYLAGYTHLQKAQPVTLGHYLLAYYAMFHRDILRFSDALERTDVMPLGSGALAGTTFNLDRLAVAKALGFSQISLNSLDAVSDRDFCIEFTACASIAMMHLSRLCEELILWSSQEFGFVQMDDAYSTGSSLMPQKKNPDVAELVRGKSGRVYGDLMALLTMMKGLPLAYNKDMQEDKEALFDASDTLCGCLDIFLPMLRTLQFNTQRMLDGALQGYTNATDLADYLVSKGVPFRDAHALSGRLVHDAIAKGLALHELPLSDMQAISPLIQADIYQAISLEACVQRREVDGGPGPKAVDAAIQTARKQLEALQF